MRSTITLIAFLALSAPGYSVVIHIPGDHPTIQAGIDAAADGDTVLVAPGTYMGLINFKGKAILVAGSHGPALTVLDGNQSGRIVTFAANEPPQAVLQGFTVTNGSAVDGGGVFCLEASPTITDNIICSNKASMSGGGIFCYKSTPTITDNVIRDNNAGWSGGGINCSKSDSYIARNRVYRNSCGKRGGGVRFAAGSFILIDNIVFENVGRYGGGMTSGSYPSMIINNMFFDNKATYYGGGLHCNGEYTQIVNCTVFNNSADYGGGGFCTPYNSTTSITNSILWDNSAPEGAEIWMGSTAQPSSLTLSHSNLQRGAFQVYVESGCILDTGPGMIDAQPLFHDPARGDLHLTFGSPCRDAGDSQALGIPEEDFEGNPRTAYAAADMGADEFHPHLYGEGDAVPGGVMDLKFVGWPGTAQVALVIGFDLFTPPLSGGYGDWYIKPPMIILPGLGPIPSNGVYVLPGSLPLSPPAPYSVHFQAMIDWALTGLYTLHVE